MIWNAINRAGILLFSLILYLPNTRAEEPPQITRLNPVTASRGEGLEIRATGQFKSWPVQIWSSSPDVSWSCLEEPGVFQVTVAESFTLQNAWFRFFNSAGSTPVRPILISSAPVASEIEPNDKPSTATPILPDQSVSGVLEKNVDVDCFQVELSEGDVFSAVIDSHRYGTPVDANLQILDDRGFVLMESIDHFGLDPALEIVAPHSGSYIVKVFAFPAEPDSTISFRGGADWWYRLRCRLGPLEYEIPSDRAPHLEQCSPSDAKPGNTPATASTLRLNEKLLRRIESQKGESGRRTAESHYYQLPQAAGTTLRVQVTARSMGSQLDPVLTIVNEKGEQHVFQDDADNERDVSIFWKIPDDANYYAVVGDFHRRGGPKHDYWLSITSVEPAVSIFTSADAYQGKTNQDIDIALKFETLAGWTGEVELSPLDENLELVIEPSTLTIDKPKSDLTVKIKSAKPYAGVLPIQIKQKGSDNPSPVTTAAAPVPAWLTVTE
ncbi:hypothetical protein SH449x_002547 [Pirellulaceae bacterium SH449]